jgi:Tfp pilus assembly protein PilN
MPLRINLLAEAQAAEEFRRRDPVKRAAYVGAMLIAALLAWASLLQARMTLNKAQVSKLEGKIAALDGDYTEIIKSQKTLIETRERLVALKRLSTNRYLTGNLLDALQTAYVDGVRVVKLKTRFDYTMTAPTRPKTNAFSVIPGKPATAAEQITVQIEAKDSSETPGDQVDEYKKVVASLPHLKDLFQEEEKEVRLTSLNPPGVDEAGRSYVLFTLECKYPEKVR